MRACGMLFIVVCLSSSLHSAVLESSGGFVLDIDGDGVNDLPTVILSSDPDPTGPPSEIYFNTTAGSGALPGPPVLGGVATFGTATDFEAFGTDSVFSGIGTLNNAASSGASSSVRRIEFVSAPLIGMWYWGSNGPNVGDEVHQLIGLVIDGRAYLEDNSNPITLYYNNYGPFAEGDSRFVSLIDTGVPIPEPSGLIWLGLPFWLLRRRRRRH